MASFRKLLLFYLCLLSSVHSMGQFGEDIRLMSPINAPWTINTDDIDGDGDVDILLGSRDPGQHSISWFENLGANYFSQRQIISTEIHSPLCIDACDLDGDGLKDIISVSNSDHKVAWYKNLDGSNFGPQNVISTDINAPVFFDVADLDGDGDKDIVVAVAGDGSVVWYKNSGAASFSPEILISDDAVNANSVDVADLDNDGDLDVISTSFVDNKVAWYENTGDGTFGPQIIIAILDGARLARCEDIDLDGDLDVLVSSSSLSSGRLVWYSNEGAAVFGEELIIHEERTKIFDLSDVDGDGDLDILTHTTSDNEFGWQENLGAGEFGPINVITDFAEYIGWVQFGELSGDGLPDAVYVSAGDNKIYWYENLDGGSFGNWQNLSYRVYTPRDVTVGDVNSDGNDDILMSSYGRGPTVILNSGNGSFSDDKRVAYAIHNSDSDFSDFDLDGDLDVIFLDSYNDQIKSVENLGDGNYGEIDTLFESVTDLQIEMGDMDLDGDEDIVIGGTNIRWAENLGAGIFAPIETIGFLGGTQDLILSDHDNDGDLDIFTTRHLADRVSMVENTGGGTFGTDVIITSEVDYPQSIYLSDLNGDGYNDLISVSSFDNKLAWYENNTDGTFGDQQIITTEMESPVTVSSADIDLDGDPDIVLGSYIGEDNHGIVWWFENLGEANFADGEIIVDQLDTRTNDLYMTDIDNDGDIDVLGSASTDEAGYYHWFENNYLAPLQITGTIFVDLNENGVQDSLDVGLPIADIGVSPDPEFLYRYENGDYFVNFNGTSDEPYMVSPVDHEYWGITTDSSSYTVLVDEEFSSIDSLDFGFSPIVLLDSLTCSLTGGFPRCNTLTNYWINYSNKGTTFPFGIIQLDLDEDLLYVDSEITPDSIVENSVFWHYDSLFYFESEMLNLVVEMPDFMSMGDTLSSVLSVNVNVDGEAVFYSSDTLNQVLVCAYDPNDKLAVPSGIDSLGFIHPSVDQMEYTIRFQNTGNDTAFHVKIKDYLDSNLNWESIEVISSSHELNTVVFPTGEVQFKFDDIMLPDSTTDFLGSQGFVKYSINLKDSVEVGTSIYNTAHIYFDSNPAVITNTKINTLYDCSTILSSLAFESSSCENYLVESYLETAPSNGGYIWQIDEIVLVENDSINWLADTSGTFEIELGISTDFCFLDTILEITILPESITELETIRFCEGDSAFVFDDYYLESSIHTDTLISATYCDSILIQEIVVLPLPVVEIVGVDDDTICITDGGYYLSGTPSGGVFSGSGMLGNTFLPPLAGSGEHYVFYSYEDEEGCFSSDSSIFFVTDCLGLNENETNSILLYPNPAQNSCTLFINPPFNEGVRAELRNISGEIVFERYGMLGNQIKIELDKLSSGNYFFSLFDSNGIERYSALLTVE